MLFEILFILAGLGGLWLGAELVIKGALNTAEHFKISHTFVGLTVLAVGTSLPELFVSVFGALNNAVGINSSGIVVGDIIGSCFGNIGLLLGTISLIVYVTLTRRELLRDGLMLVASVVLLIIVSLDGVISFREGMIFLIIYAIYLWTLVREEKKTEEEVKRAPRMNMLWDLASLIGGFFMISAASHLVVNNGIVMAQLLGVDQTIIGILLVGLGTNIPEVVVSVGALIKGASRLSVGNILGSNIFNILGGLGAASLISDIAVSARLLRFDIIYLLLFYGVVLFFMAFTRGIQKREAVVMIGIYMFYVILKIAGV